MFIVEKYVGSPFKSHHKWHRLMIIVLKNPEQGPLKKSCDMEGAGESHYPFCEGTCCWEYKRTSPTFLPLLFFFLSALCWGPYRPTPKSNRAFLWKSFDKIVAKHLGSIATWQVSIHAGCSTASSFHSSTLGSHGNADNADSTDTLNLNVTSFVLSRRPITKA